MTFSDQDKNKALSMAGGMADDFDQKQAAEFINQHEDKTWYTDFILLYRMIIHPEYSMSATTWAVIAGALAYVIFPMDVLPDFLPILGWIDDTFVLSTVVVTLSDEINSFKTYLSQQ